LRAPVAFACHLAKAKKLNWVVYAKRPFAGPQQVLDSAPALCMQLCEVEPDGSCPHGCPSLLRGAASSERPFFATACRASRIHHISGSVPCKQRRNRRALRVAPACNGRARQARSATRGASTGLTPLIQSYEQMQEERHYTFAWYSLGRVLASASPTPRHPVPQQSSGASMLNQRIIPMRLRISQYEAWQIIKYEPSASRSPRNPMLGLPPLARTRKPIRKFRRRLVPRPRVAPPQGFGGRTTPLRCSNGANGGMNSSK
jgi:hypothetical protein